MNLLRRIGWFALLAAVIAVGWKVLTPRQSAVTIVGEPPEGFRLPVEGLGEVGFGVRGPVRITLSREQREPEGVRTATRRLTIDGRDPRPVETAMALDQTVIRALDTDGHTLLYRLKSPRALLALKAGAAEPTPDLSRPWKLDSPVLTLPTERGELVLEVEAAALVPDEQILRGEGAFTLQSGGMAFSGKDLQLDLESGQVDFGEGWPLAWSFPTVGGGLFRGRSDGGGSLTELEDGGRRLVLPAGEFCELELPPETGLEGLFRCGGFEVELNPAPETGGWVPRSARGEAPSSWTGILANDRESSVFGQDAVLVWDGEPFHGIDLRGPLVAFLGENSLGVEGGWLASGGGAYLRASDLELELYGGVGGQLEQGWFETETYRAGQGGWVAEGGVSLADGQVVADRFEETANGSKHLDGAVLFRPAPGIAVAAPRLTLRAQDELRPGFRQFHAEGGVVTHLDLKAEPVVLRSLELDAQGDLGEVEEAAGADSGGKAPEQVLVPAGVRLDARHSVRLERDEAVFTGEHFAAHAEDRLELRGSPARAEMPRRDALGEQIGTAIMEADRLVLHEGEVIPVGNPRLAFPAAELGLTGDEIRLRAQRMRFREDGNAGSLHGSVRAEGGLELEAASAVWVLVSGSFDEFSFMPEDGTRGRETAKNGIAEDGEPEQQDRILTLRSELGGRVVLRGQLLPEPAPEDERAEEGVPVDEPAVGKASDMKAGENSSNEPDTKGWSFDLQARGMVVNLETRVGILDGDARMRLEPEGGKQEEETQVLELRGRYARVSIGSGFFLHNATLSQGDGNGGVKGGAERIDWERGEDGTILRLSKGRPWLEAQGVKAEAAEIVLELNGTGPEDQVLKLAGSAGRPARLTLPGGRVLVGERLRYNFRTRLYDTGSSRLATEDDLP